MTLRKILFWCHLACGVVAGVVIFIMSVTGALLAYEKQIVLWADTRQFTVAPGAGSPRLSVESLVAKAQESEPQAAFTGITVRAGANSPVALAAGQRTLYVDPFDGRILGEASPGVRRFFRVVTDWHRTLAMSGERRTIGRAFTGASNLAFLFIVASGIYLWWPKAWTTKQLRSVTLFNWSLRGKPRDFNWHNTIGFWSAIPLFFVVLGATVISYPWASDLAYRMVGEEPPPRQRPPAAAPGPQGGPGGTSGGERPERGGRTGSGERRRPSLAGLDNLWPKAEQQVAEWRSINLRIPTGPDAPVVFTIDRGYAGQPQKRGTLTLNRASGEVVSWEPYASLSTGRRLRTWLRFVHTGEFYGLAGQTIAGVASAGGAVLVYTGLALAFRRCVAWRARRRSPRRDYQQPAA
jgi:uncharacterized iron-regulated membrane protein